MGETPLYAHIRPGRHRLEVSHPNGIVVQENLETRAGVGITREFDLVPKPRAKPRRLRPPVKSVENPDPGSSDDASAEPLPVQPQGPTPRELLRRAQSFRASRQWRKAAEAYALLVELFPLDNRARAARVSLGQLQLDRLGEPQAALASFLAYHAIAPGGVLAQEATHGRLRALRALGRSEEERAAISDYLDAYPLSAEAGPLRQRLKQLHGQGLSKDPSP